MVVNLVIFHLSPMMFVLTIKFMLFTYDFSTFLMNLLHFSLFDPPISMKMAKLSAQNTQYLHLLTFTLHFHLTLPINLINLNQLE